MTEFYEPMLYMSTPEHPNTMGMLAVLKDPVDGDLLQETVEQLRVRFPYYYVKVISKENNLSTEANPLPMTVRNTWDAIALNSAESNDHMAAWKYEGKRLAFEISHTLTDGAGVLPYFKSVLFLYLSRKLGISFDRTGFRLPGDVIPESETGNPFAGLDIDDAEEPLYNKPTEADFYRLSDGSVSEPQVTCIRLSEAQLMQYCKDFDGSPNVFLAVILARAIRSYDPASEKTVSVSIAVNHKAILGNYDNYRLGVNVAELDFPKDRLLDDLMKACTIARGQLILQTQPENSLWALKQRKAVYAKMDQVPLQMKLDIMAKSAGSTRWSASISYTSSRSFGPLDPYIEEFYALAEPGVSDLVCEVSCLNQSFFLSIAQSGAYDAFMDVFLKELSSVGIDYEVIRKEPFHLCGTASFSGLLSA